MSAEPELSIATEAAAIRAFNRFYTQRIGVLGSAPLGGPFSLTEGRVLYELSHRDAPAASELCRDLGLDRGYLSRILARFQKQGLVERSRSLADGRQSHIRLTAKGAEVYDGIDRAWQSATEGLIAPLAPSRRQNLVISMQRVHALLADADEGVAAESEIHLRPHRLGDMGWIIQRHALVYGEQFGWNEEFEALVAEIAGNFLRDYDPAREHCWIAERDGAPVGCVFLVKDSDEVGRLRLLFVEPSARGLGVGTRLVAACVERAREIGYRKVTLYTNDVLVSARRIYHAAGFRLAKEWPHKSFGKDLVGQNWDIEV
jgi:DNA-binding MarR family transcriptional regulator/N-acetylglutamate synthase-like GNAT family acetyltransferase